MSNFKETLSAGERRLHDLFTMDAPEILFETREPTKRIAELRAITRSVPNRVWPSVIYENGLRETFTAKRTANKGIDMRPNN